MAASGITESDLLDALAAALPGKGPAEAKHAEEIQRATGLNEKQVRRALRAVAAEGRLQLHRVTRERLDGSPFTCTAYTITPKP